MLETWLSIAAIVSIGFAAAALYARAEEAFYARVADLLAVGGLIAVPVRAYSEVPNETAGRVVFLITLLMGVFYAMFRFDPFGMHLRVTEYDYYR